MGCGFTDNTLKPLRRSGLRVFFALAFCQEISFHYSCISSLVGIAAWAPLRVTVTAAARLAKDRAYATVLPIDSSAHNAPQKVSPAAVVSTTGILMQSSQTISPLEV